MSKIDDYRLKLLYENLYKTDYLRLNEHQLNDFNWDEFFTHDYVLGNPWVLLEDFQKISDKKPIESGFLDVYKLTLNNGLEFELNISYNNANEVRNSSKRRILDADHKRQRGVPNMEDIISGYERIKDIQDGQYVALLEFRDSQNRHSATGEVKETAHELFSMLHRAIMDGFFEGKMIDSLVGVIMLVNNSEPRRLSIYKRMLSRGFKDYFPHIFEDFHSLKERNITLLLATK